MKLLEINPFANKTPSLLTRLSHFENKKKIGPFPGTSQIGGDRCPVEKKSNFGPSIRNFFKISMSTFIITLYILFKIASYSSISSKCCIEFSLPHVSTPFNFGHNKPAQIPATETNYLSISLGNKVNTPQDIHVSLNDINFTKPGDPFLLTKENYVTLYNAAANAEINPM